MCVRDITLKCVQCLQSDIGGNVDSNIAFTQVKAGDSESQKQGLTCLGVISNRIFDSHEGHGISLLGCSSVLIENNEI